ncbi:hypothetical protein DORLON_01146 [Dorea longicatena DSM 13814]|uniref:Uncharacterized protein n=1 Tax=Dorea longicatena DSM 13814 TaxID=411462 RepID=A6BFS5_9FIRM|nr:hypothetical protein DORLON_01146 [Dorea longicatena DSM 13814]
MMLCLSSSFSALPCSTVNSPFFTISSRSSFDFSPVTATAPIPASNTFFNPLPNFSIGRSPFDVYIDRLSKSFGINMIIPAIAAMIAAISTAPAAASFASFASGFLSSVTRSTTASTAVFTISNAMTRPNNIRQIHHSTGVI